MEQPPRFIDISHPDYICWLNKSLYGLKQTMRELFQRLSIFFLLQQGFCCSQADASFFFIKVCESYICSYMLTTLFLPTVMSHLYVGSSINFNFH